MIDSEIRLPRSMQYEPDRLLAAHQRLPLMAGDYVPIGVYDRPLQAVEPRLLGLGRGALSISIGRPFGFLSGIDIGAAEAGHHSPKTSEIILAPDPDLQDKWHATFKTPKPLTEADSDLIGRGINLYITHAQFRLLNLYRP